MSEVLRKSFRVTALGALWWKGKQIRSLVCTLQNNSHKMTPPLSQDYLSQMMTYWLKSGKKTKHWSLNLKGKRNQRSTGKMLQRRGRMKLMRWRSSKMNWRSNSNKRKLLQGSISHNSPQNKTGLNTSRKYNSKPKLQARPHHPHPKQKSNQRLSPLPVRLSPNPDMWKFNFRTNRLIYHFKEEVPYWTP